MTNFAASVLHHWEKTFAASDPAREAASSVSVNARLTPKRPAMMLERSDGSVRAVVRPELVGRIAGDGPSRPSADDLRKRFADAGIALHDPDYLFYLPADAEQALDPLQVARRLSEADRTAFETFSLAAPEQDRDNAFVELDHWAVYACFEGDRLVSAASMCLWDNGPIADLGVLTLPDRRGKGYARTVVQSLNHFTRLQGYEPQYRCQTDNHPSVALAKACGLKLFGTWQVAVDGD